MIFYLTNINMTRIIIEPEYILYFFFYWHKILTTSYTPLESSFDLLSKILKAKPHTDHWLIFFSFIAYIGLIAKAVLFIVYTFFKFVPSFVCVCFGKF